jgi:hypothetical protein
MSKHSLARNYLLTISGSLESRKLLVPKLFATISTREVGSFRELPDKGGLLSPLVEVRMRATNDVLGNILSSMQFHARRNGVTCRIKLSEDKQKIDSAAEQ